MMLDVDKLRADTPGCRAGLIHLNNAGAALMPSPVLDVMQQHLAREAMNGGYEASTDADPALAGFYASAARLVGGAPSEIAFVDSATRAWLAVFASIDWQEGDEVVTASSEYASHMISFRLAEQRYGIRLRIAPDTAAGAVDPEALERLIGARTRLICISHMPTNDGLVNPVKEIGRIAKRHGVAFLLDACQSVGQLPMDVAAIGCTMLSATGRKYLRGPRGTGFLWVSDEWANRTVPATLDLMSAVWTDIDRFEIATGARRFELWERSVVGQIGLAAACDYAMSTGIPAIWERTQSLARHLRTRLREVPGVRVLDRGAVQSGIVTFVHRDIPAETLVKRLRREAGINTSVSAVQLTRNDLTIEGVRAMVRASVHAYNTFDEIENLAQTLAGMAKP